MTGVLGCGDVRLLGCGDEGVLGCRVAGVLGLVGLFSGFKMLCGLQN